ncbi:pyrroline-5-carboxylate reductase [bacterium]|nr:pyrroline-5-carboxylate reductase [bacterium]
MTYFLGIIGGGRMGYAILESMIKRGHFDPRGRGLIAADPDPKALDRARRLGCDVTHDSRRAAAKSSHVLLAVKPQMIDDVAAEIGESCRGKRILSILAGTTRVRLAGLFPGAQSIVRIMPNLPLTVGAGATVVARDGLTAADKRVLKNIFDPMGILAYVPERLMNAVTALSGSGPAFFCAFLEALTAAAVRAGLPGQTARVLAAQTLAGTSELLRRKNVAPDELRRRVTSPGGTTEAGLAAFRRGGLDRIAGAAIRAAIRRGRELSR